MGYLNEADTGIDDVLGSTATVELPPLESMIGLPDFEWAARKYMNTTAYTYQTWDYFKQLQNLTSLPIILKGIMTVEDAQLAYDNGVKAIILSNHGARQLDGAPSSLEAACEIHAEAPELFKQMEIYADGGVRYGSDVLKLLALGVKAVGLGRSFMYANCYGTEGVAKAISILKREISIDAANLGVGDLKKIDPSYVKWENNNWWS